MSHLRLLVALLLTVLVTGMSSPAPAQAVPTREQWLKDVNKVMKGSGAYLRDRTESVGIDETLAINFDIDNSSIASYYDGPQRRRDPEDPRSSPTRPGASASSLVFNTGRLNTQRERTINQLTDAGYDVAMLCMRKKGETIPHGKQRCRNKFINAGYTLIANVGNNPTDFVGDGYERAYRLPNYGGELG